MGPNIVAKLQWRNAIVYANLKAWNCTIVSKTGTEQAARTAAQAAQSAQHFLRGPNIAAKL
jgi:hypothetical protein